MRETVEEKYKGYKKLVIQGKKDLEQARQRIKSLEQLSAQTGISKVNKPHVKQIDDLTQAIKKLQVENDRLKTAGAFKAREHATASKHKDTKESNMALHISNLESELDSYRNELALCQEEVQVLTKDRLSQVRFKTPADLARDREELSKRQAELKNGFLELQNREAALKDLEIEHDKMMELENVVIGKRGWERAKDIDLARARKQGETEALRKHKQDRQRLEDKAEELELRENHAGESYESLRKRTLRNIRPPVGVFDKKDCDLAFSEGFYKGYLEANKSRDLIEAKRFEDTARDEVHPYNRGKTIAAHAAPLAMAQQSFTDRSWDICKYRVDWTLQELDTTLEEPPEDREHFWWGVMDGAMEALTDKDEEEKDEEGKEGEEEKGDAAKSSE